MSLAVAVAPARAEEQAALQFPEPLVLRVAGEETSLLLAANGVVKSVALQVRELKDPAGADVPLGSLVLVPASIPAVGVSGVRIAVQAPRKAFSAYGDYRITLYAEGTAPKGKVTALKSGTLTRPRPEVSAPSLKDRTILLSRSCPFATASGDAETAVLIGGAPTTEGITFGVRVNASTESATAPPGQATAAFANSQPGGTGFKPVSLRFTDFERTGTFAAALIAVVPGTAPAEVPFTVVVTDPAIWATLAIAAGVGLAFFVQFLSNRLRPLAQGRLRLLQMSSLLSSLRWLTGEAQRWAEVDELLARLAQGEEALSVATPDATATLDQIAEEIKSLRTKIHEDQSKAFAAASDTMIAIEAAASVARSDAQRTEIAHLREREAAAREHLRSGRHIQAAGMLAQIKATAQALEEAFKKAAAEEAARRGARPSLTPAAPPAAGPSIRVDTPQPALLAQREIGFELDDPRRELASATEVVWDFGDGAVARLTAAPLQVTHVFHRAGTYTVTATAGGAGTPSRVFTASVIVGHSPVQEEIGKTAAALWELDLLISAIAAIVAVATGLWLFHSGKPFGSVAQYAEAFVWGFGVDNTVRGFAAVAKKLVV